jgi:hypothetical protein
VWRLVTLDDHRVEPVVSVRGIANIVGRMSVAVALVVLFVAVPIPGPVGQKRVDTVVLVVAGPVRSTLAGLAQRRVQRAALVTIDSALRPPASGGHHSSKQLAGCRAADGGLPGFARVLAASRTGDGRQV